jgi:putative salt-induced outer membrane protein YdiY
MRILLFVLLPFSLARAQDVALSQPDAKEAEDKPEGAITADLGTLLTAGNSLSATLAAGLHVEVKRAKNRLRFDIAGNFALGDGDRDGRLRWPEELSALQAGGDLRYDRFLGERTSLYGTVGARHDRFAHLVIRPHGQVGLAHEFVKTDRHVIVGEAGFDYAAELYGFYEDPALAPISPVHFFAARLHARYGLTLAPNLLFTEQIEALPAGTTDPARRFAMRLSSGTALQVRLHEVASLSSGSTHDSTSHHRPRRSPTTSRPP